MTPRDAQLRLLAAASCLLACWAGACHTKGAVYPWPSQVNARPFEHAEVRTLNADYDRSRSRVLVREIDRPTRANLDYAAYHADFMNAEEAPEPAANSGKADARDPFSGSIDSRTLTPDIMKTPLSEAERRRPLALAPLLEFALAQKVTGTESIEAANSAVRTETWGLSARPGSASQQISEAFVHRPSGTAPELWVKIEFAAWFDGLGSLPDQDGDGVPELYGRVAGTLGEPLLQLIETEYAGRVLDSREVANWANQLASYWYPSFNTDLVQPPASWPDSQTEADIKAELGGKVFASPKVVMRGKPQGRATYAVFMVKPFGGAMSQPTAATGTPAATLALPPSKPSPLTQPLIERIQKELAAFGPNGWAAWNKQLAGFHDALRTKLKSLPAVYKAIRGSDDYLFFRTSMESVTGGEIEAQAEGKNPLPAILEWKRTLDAHGVDFLFVPVPSKEEIYPDALDPASKTLVGQVVHPALRKFLLTLSEQGVEVVDLLTPLLAARAAGDVPNQEPLYQHQDTHWSTRGLQLAAGVLGERIKRYPWYGALARHAQAFSVRETIFTRFGDLHSRLPEWQKKRYRPETLRAEQVLRTNGTLYEADPDSPITVLGDSFTGVYELTDAEHAGISAHLARTIGYPIDLVMSYGGGPNVRNKLMRRGAAALDQKKLVIWVMAARDLYDYDQGWEPLASGP